MAAHPVDALAQRLCSLVACDGRLVGRLRVQLRAHARGVLARRHACVCGLHIAPRSARR